MNNTLMRRASISLLLRWSRWQASNSLRCAASPFRARPLLRMINGEFPIHGIVVIGDV